MERIPPLTGENPQKLNQIFWYRFPIGGAKTPAYTAMNLCIGTIQPNIANLPKVSAGSRDRRSNISHPRSQIPTIQGQPGNGQIVQLLAVLANLLPPRTSRFPELPPGVTILPALA